MNTTTISGGAVAMTTCAHARVWRERPVTRLAAAGMAPVQGTTLSGVGQLADQSGKTGPIAFPAPIAINYMDVPPFRTGRPPV